MKKIIAIVLLLTMALFAFTACGEPEATTKIRVGYLQGPTGMGMAKLIYDNGGAETGNEKYSFKKYTDSSAALKDLTKGEIDVICAPTNEAAVYSNTDNWITVLAINTLGSLYLATDSNTEITAFDQLSGKTVYTCKNGTPKKVLEYLISAYKLENVTISTSVDGKELVTPADLGKAIKDGLVDIVVVPEPILTSSTLGSAEYSVDLKLNDVWDAKCETELTMGCVVSTTNFVNKNKAAIKAFLNEYKASIEFINNPENLETAANYVVKTGVMGAVPAAKSALKNLSGAIAYIDGKDMKAALVAFYKAIGIAEPTKNTFYYAK